MNDDVVEIDLLQIWNIIKKNIITIISICLLCSAIGFSCAKFLLPKQYKTSTKIIVVKDETESTSSVTVSDLQISQKLATVYKQIIMSEAISDEVIANLDLDTKYGFETKDYSKIVNVTSEDNTEVLTVSVETTDPELSANIANEIVDVFIGKIYDIYDVKNVSVLNRAKVPEKKSGPSGLKYTMIGGCLGLLISAAIVMIKLLTDTKVKTEDEIKEIFDYPIIGTIPDFAVEDDEQEVKEEENND